MRRTRGEGPEKNVLVPKKLSLRKAPLIKIVEKMENATTLK